MLHIALWEPQIPPNTGNIARTCAATGTVLHLIGALGFHLGDRDLRRAGLDFWDAVELRQHASYGDFDTAWTAAGNDVNRIFALTTKGGRKYTEVAYQDGDCLLFGNETSGLPAEMIARFGARALVVPMPTGKVRSLNLATTAGIVLYEALRQVHGW